ncbi:FBD-associated F-box protein [Rhynchospora pubera]|uniref:FBD-associated F-box protein n=1 Tax=Rhynchospora pubera TaxID=906938 RepID=A0AAV8EVC4_9POAL|nr:FBD-associated F-box protein [Rhynchospora pubera]
MGRGEDRISNLANEILHSILCLMPLKYAIRTSTLSKRWRHLWQINLISSTSLQFGEDFSCNQSPKQFVATLDRYLQLHGDRNLDKFGILFSPFDVFFPNLENWVATVLAKGVKDLEIDLSQGFVGVELKLQKLVIVDCFNVFVIEISAPKLESFVYYGCISFWHDFGNVSKVNDAYICADTGGEVFAVQFFTILSDLSHVKVLTICSMGLMHLISGEHEYYEDNLLLGLHNLQELQLVLDSINEEQIYCIVSFFRLWPSPFLEKLFLQLTSNYYNESISWSAQEMIPDIVFPNLKFIKITNFGGSSLELKLVKFFLERAIVLDSIYILLNQSSISNNSLSRRIIQGQLSVLPKASKDALIVICGPLDCDCTINPTHTTLYHEENRRNGTTMHLDDDDIMSRENILLDQEFL